MTQILQGIRVLEVAQWWFVPSAGAALRDWGAEIIKVEHPEEGDPQRGLMTSGMVPGGTGVNFMMEQPNRGKKSITLNLKSPDGVELLYKLAETCDVFLTSFLPDLRQRLGIDVEHIRARNPNIIYVRGSGQGVRGPEINKAGYDGTSYWCRSGMAYAMTRKDAESPAGQRPAFGDGVGGLTIAGGIAGALFHRERTGEATTVDVSLLATAMTTFADGVPVSPTVNVCADPVSDTVRDDSDTVKPGDPQLECEMDRCPLVSVLVTEFLAAKARYTLQPDGTTPVPAPPAPS